VPASDSTSTTPRPVAKPIEGPVDIMISIAGQVAIGAAQTMVNFLEFLFEGQISKISSRMNEFSL
jgi:hypothetical protein